MAGRYEYLFVNHDIDSTFAYPTVANPAAALRHSTGDADENIWRVGLNFKLFDRREDTEPLK